MQCFRGIGTDVEGHCGGVPEREERVLGQIRMEALQNKAVKKGFIDETWNKVWRLWRDSHACLGFKMVPHLNPVGNMGGFIL